MNLKSNQTKPNQTKSDDSTKNLVQNREQQSMNILVSKKYFRIFLQNDTRC